MAKFCGIIGYALTVEPVPGISEEKIIENQYFGDVISNSRRLQERSKVNDDINILVYTIISTFNVTLANSINYTWIYQTNRCWRLKIYMFTLNKILKFSL